MVFQCNFSGKCKIVLVTCDPPDSVWGEKRQSYSAIRGTWGKVLSQSCDIWLPVATETWHTSNVKLADSRQEGLVLTQQSWPLPAARLCLNTATSLWNQPGRAGATSWRWRYRKHPGHGDILLPNWADSSVWMEDSVYLLIVVWWANRKICLL